MSCRQERFATFAILLLTVFGSHAEVSEERVGFRAAVDVARYMDNNIYTASTGTISSSITTLSTSLKLKSSNLLGLQYEGEYSKYSHNSKDNTQNHLLSLQTELRPSRKLNLKVKGFYQGGADAVNATLSGSNTPDVWKQNNLGVLLRYGVEGARGNLLLEADRTSKRYTTNLTQTAALERDDLLVATALHFRFWPKSVLFIRAEQIKINYISSDSDSVLRRYFGGMKWNATGKTSGSLRIGKTGKSFSNTSIHRDQSGANWSAAIYWNPLRHSRITLSADKDYYDTTGGSYDVIDRRRRTLKWIYGWSSRVTSDIRYNSHRDSYTGLVGTGRNDSINGYIMNVDYQLGRLWTLGIGYTSEQRSSNVDLYDFSRKIGKIHIKAAL